MFLRPFIEHCRDSKQEWKETREMCRFLRTVLTSAHHTEHSTQHTAAAAHGNNHTSGEVRIGCVGSAHAVESGAERRSTSIVGSA